MMRFVPAAALGLAMCGHALAQNNFDREVVEAERLPESAMGEVIVESLDEVLKREAVRIASGEKFQNRRDTHGKWAVPAPYALYTAHSGEKALVNKWGDTSMGIGFQREVTVHGAWFGGQGSGEKSFARGVRAVGYRAGEVVATSKWLRDLSREPRYLEMNLERVDRVVIEALPSLNGGGWYAMDDLSFGPVGSSAGDESATVLDFEDLDFKATLSNSEYAGIKWEVGTGSHFKIDEGVQAPIMFEDKPEPAGAEEAPRRDAARGGGGTAPTLTDDFIAIKRGDANQFSFPPDTCGAVGPGHFMCVVNTTVGIYTKNGNLVSVTSLQSFFPGSSGGDPRVVFDQHSQRWIVTSTNFNNRIYVGVSETDDPTGTWIKGNFLVSTGVLNGCWPDFPTLGYDDDGIYIAAFMFNGCAQSMWVLEKDAIINSGTIPVPWVFANFTGFVGAVQPCHTFGNVGQGAYTIERKDSNELRIRQVTGSLSTGPSLSLVGDVPVPSNSSPPDAIAAGTSTPLDTVDTRLSQSVFRDGSIWTSHCINRNGRAGVRWYEVDVSSLSAIQVGNIDDPSLNFFMPSIAVNGNGDAVIGFTGSDANTYPSAYFCGRSSLDAANIVSTPQVYRAGTVANYNLVDGFGRNRWGDYSATTLDPADDETLWTIQEYVHSTNTWGTQVAKLEYNPSAPGAFSLIAPAEGETGVSLSPTFVWSASSGTNGYLLEVDDQADFSSPEISQATGLTSFTATGDPLLQSTQYFWRVTSENPFGETVSSPPAGTFFTDGPPPGFFVLVSPADGGVEPDDEVTFEWSASSTATSYRLEVDDNADFSSPEIDNSALTPGGGSTETFTSAPGILQAGETYNWRVTSFNVIGSTAAANGPATFEIESGGGCDGDTDGNGTVDINDVSFVIFRLGDSGAACLPGDADGSGVVDVNDISYVIFRLGTCETTGPCS